MDIYLAGKVGPNQTWRSECVPDIARHAPLDTEDDAWPVVPMGAQFLAHRYTGPYFVDLQAHDWPIHGNKWVTEKHDGEERTRGAVVKRCLEAVRRSHLVVAWIEESQDPYNGTLFELGYAKGLGKKTAVVISDRVADENNRMWFAETAADYVWFSPSITAGLLEVLRYFGKPPVTIIPFGQYRGQSVEVLLKDPSYVRWIESKPDLAKKFSYILRDLSRLKAQK